MEGPVVFESRGSGPPRSSATRNQLREYGRHSLRAETNQEGCTDHFYPSKEIEAISTNSAFPDKLRTAKLPVQNFWTYDGAYNTVTHGGKMAGNPDELLPVERLHEADFVAYQRYGSKKGWLYNSPECGVGPYRPEQYPTHTQDGWPNQIKQRRWRPDPSDPTKQELAERQMPKIDIVNNARGIGRTGEGSGSGGMSGGYQEVNPKRLKFLPIPQAKFNWTGTRAVRTGREDQSGAAMGAGAGGFRAGYASRYPSRVYIPPSRSAITGLIGTPKN